MTHFPSFVEKFQILKKTSTQISKSKMNGTRGKKNLDNVLESDDPEMSLLSQGNSNSDERLSPPPTKKQDKCDLDNDGSKRSKKSSSKKSTKKSTKKSKKADSEDDLEIERAELLNLRKKLDKKAKELEAKELKLKNESRKKADKKKSKKRKTQKIDSSDSSSGSDSDSDSVSKSSSGSSSSTDSEAEFSSLKKLKKNRRERDSGVGILRAPPADFTIVECSLLSDLSNLIKSVPSTLTNLVRDEKSVQNFHENLSILGSKFSAMIDMINDAACSSKDRSVGEKLLVLEEVRDWINEWNRLGNFPKQEAKYKGP